MALGIPNLIQTQNFSWIYDLALLIRLSLSFCTYKTKNIMLVQKPIFRTHWPRCVWKFSEVFTCRNIRRYINCMVHSTLYSSTLTFLPGSTSTITVMGCIMTTNSLKSVLLPKFISGIPKKKKIFQ